MILTLLLFTVSAFGQVDKAERKFWKQEAKKYKKNPELLKDLVETNEDLTTELEVNEFELDSLIAAVKGHEANLTSVNRKLKQAEKQLGEQRALVTKLQTELKASAEKNIKGTFYRVQIGAYAKRDLKDYAGESVNLQVEKDQGIQKYTVGMFRDKSDAEAFRTQIVAIGIKDAWIVKYIDGQRVK
ncbi:MAG: hypothetical protein Roseis2KO_06970 [Roseivirga sp.]